MPNDPTTLRLSTALAARMSPGERADVVRRVLQDPSVVELAAEIRDVATRVQMLLPELDGLALRAIELQLAGDHAVRTAADYDAMQVQDANEIDFAVGGATGQRWLQDVMNLVRAIADVYDDSRPVEQHVRDLRRTYGLPQQP